MEEKERKFRFTSIVDGELKTYTKTEKELTESEEGVLMHELLTAFANNPIKNRLIFITMLMSEIIDDFKIDEI